MAKVTHIPTYVASAAVYPYSDKLLAECSKISKYGDEYSLARVAGKGEHRRIWLPRNLAPISSGVKDLRTDGQDVVLKSNFIPRNDEQQRVISETVDLLGKGYSFILEAPTGFGKTWCAMDIIAKLGKKTLIVVTKEDIRDQWVAAAEKLLGLKVGKGIGLIQGDTCLTVGQSLVIGMIQSLAKEERYPEHAFRDFGLAIWDETHRVGADYFSQSCFRVPAKLRLGISATPDRKDGRADVIHAHIGEVMVVTKAAPMTPRILAQRSPWEVPLRKQRSETGAWVMKPVPHTAGKCGHIINMLANHHGRNLILSKFTSAAYFKGRNILVQSDRKEHLEQLQAMIMNQGVPAADIAFYVGGMNEAQRTHAKTKRVILATYQMTAEATDIPQLDTLVMATPKSDVRQIVGRILRAFPDKKEPVVFDLVDDSSNVFAGYWNSRQRWYRSVNAQVDKVS